MKRLEYIDALRGWAIFLVILGHAIQQFNDKFYFLNDRVFTTIYSFHMPLFFFLSGLLFKSSLKQSFSKFISKKLLQLILPCLVWAMIFYLVQTITDSIAAGKIILNFADFRKVFDPSFWPFWFLVELFKSYVILFMLFRITKNQFAAFSIALILAFTISSEGSQRFLLPFFMLGIITKDHLIFFEKRLKLFLTGSLLLFIALLIFWNGKFTIYFSEFPALFNFYTKTFSFKNYDIALFRFAIGLAGTYFWFFLFKFIYDHKPDVFPVAWLSKIGKDTLGIYILQKSFLELFLTYYIDFYFVNKWVTSLIILPLLSFFIIQIIMIVIRIMDRNKTVRLLLIGKE